MSINVPAVSICQCEIPAGFGPTISEHLAARRFVGHLLGGELAEFVVNERQQLLSGFRVALLNAVEDVRDITHSWSLPGRSADVDTRKKEESPRDAGFKKV
jgi:hypothetical protein